MTETMNQLMRSAVDRFGPSVALSDDTTSLTYDGLWSQALRCAQRLATDGIGRGDRIAVLAADEPAAMTTYLGAWLRGATVVHVNARLAVPEVSYILQDSQAHAIVASQAHLQAARDAAHPTSVSLLGSLPELVDTDPAAADTLTEIDAADLAIIGYTSGTSGRPKGAMATHRSVARASRLQNSSMSIPRRSRLAYTGSVSFIGSFWGQVFPHLYGGGSVHFLGHYTIDSWFEAMQRHRSTYTYVASPMMVPFAEQMARSPQILDHLEIAIHTGSAAPRAQVEAVVDVMRGQYAEIYGSTEIVGTVSSTRPRMYQAGCEADDLLASVGTAVPSAKMWIERPDGSVADPGEEGVIVAQSDTLFSGYWNKPDETAAVLRADGSFVTGDIGAIDRAGFLYYRGRHSELINTGGMNVYPAEVERVVLGHPGVLAAAVFGMPHERWGESVTAAVVLRPDATVTAGEIIETCRRELAGYKKPTTVHFVDELPTNAARKVDKLRLRQLFLGRTPTDS